MLINYVGGYLEQCRSVNPFISTLVFDGSICNQMEFSVVTFNGSDIYNFTEILVSYKQIV